MPWLTTPEKYHQVLEYKWEPTGVKTRVATILSKMIEYRGQKLFRAGRKNQETSSTLLFMTFDLAKIGIHDVVVLFKSSADQSEAIQPYKTSIGPHPVTLYPLDFAAPQLGNLSFAFEVYIGSPEIEHFNYTSLSYYYSVHRFDALFGQQLWASSVDQVGTDVELVTTDGTRFHAHKFILAARSKVFAAQFQDDATQGEQDLEMNFQDAPSLEQFLKFLYTGELEGAVNPKLLAKTYNVQSLIILCEEGLRGQDQLAVNLDGLTMMLKTIPGVLEIQ